MHNHPPDNPFVPQISIFLQSGAIFELRIHLFGLASDVDVVPYNDKLFISGNVQPPIPMYQPDHNATCASHNEQSLMWTDQPYGRFGRDIPSEIKPGTECVILERCQDGGDYVIRYTVRNIKQCSFDPFQHTSHFGSSTSYYGNTVHSPNMNPHLDPFSFSRSPFQPYQGEYIVSSQESVFASNFTNARTIFEGTSQSVGVIPTQNVSAPAFCSHETVSRAFIPDNVPTIPSGQPVSSCFGPDSFAMGHHAIPSSSLEIPYSAFMNPTINTHFGEEPFISAMPVPAPEYGCPSMTLDAGAPSTGINYESMPITPNTMPMINPMLLDNPSHVHHSVRSSYHGPSHIIPEAHPSAPSFDNARTAPVVHGPPPVGLTPSLPFGSQTGTHCVLHPGQVPGSSNAIPPQASIPTQFDPHLQPHTSIEHPRGIPTETHHNTFPVPSAVSTVNPPAHSAPVAPSHQAQIASGDIHTVRSVSQANVGSSSTLNPSSSTHIGVSRVQRVVQGTVPASEVVKHSSSHSVHEAISSGATIGRSIHSVTAEKNGAVVRNLEAGHPSMVTREGPILTGASTKPDSVLPVSHSAGPVPSASISPSRDIPPGVMPQRISEAPIPRPTPAIHPGPSAPEFIMPTLDIKNPIPSHPMPSVSPEPTPIPGSSALNTSTTFLGSSPGSIESGTTGFPWRGYGSTSGPNKSVIESHEVVAQREVTGTMDVAREASEKIGVEKDGITKKEVRFSLPNVRDVVDTGSKSVSVAATSASDVKAMESHSVVSGISTSGHHISEETSSSSQRSNIEQETLSTSQTAGQSSSAPAASSETFVSGGQTDTAVNSAINKVVEVEENKTSAGGKSVVGQVSSVESDTASIVVQALTGAAVEAVQNVLDGETLTEAIKHSAGSAIRNVVAQVSGVQHVSEMEKGIMESISSSSNQASISGQTSVSKSLLDCHQDVSTKSAAGSVQETAQSTTQIQAAAGDPALHAVEQADATAQPPQNQITGNALGAAITTDSTIDSVSKSSASAATIEASTTAQCSTGSAGIVTTESAVTSTRTVSATESVVTVSKSGTEQIRGEDVISEGNIIEKDISKSVAEASGTVKSEETQIAEVGSVHTGAAVNSEVSQSQVKQIIADPVSTSEGQLEIQLPVTGPAQAEEVVIEGEVSKSEAVQVEKAATTSASKEHTVAQSAEVGPVSTETIITVGGETSHSTDVIASSTIPQASSSRDVGVSATSATEMHTSNTIVTNSSTVEVSTKDVATSESQAKSQDNDQTALVSDKLLAEENKTSGANVPTPVDSDAVPVPAPASSAALRTSTRQDVSFENKTNNSNMSTIVRGNIQSQDVQARESPSEGVIQAGQSTVFSEHELAQANTVIEGSTSRQQEKQKEPDLSSIILLEPPTPVDLVIAVPTSSSSKFSPASQDVIEQPMTTLDEKIASSSSSKLSGLSGSKAKEIEAQASITAFPVITSSTSSAIPKDTLYTAASSSVPLQDDPPPAYSPARTNTLVSQSNVSVQSQVGQASSTETRSLSTAEVEVTSVQEDASRATSSKVVDRAETTTSTSEASSGIASLQRPSLLRGSSSFSDFVEVQHEESSEREALSLSDSSNSSAVVVRAGKTRLKPSASYKVESHTHGTGVCLDDCCYWAREGEATRQRMDEQVTRLSDISELTDVEQSTQLTRGKTLSDSIHSAKSIDSFVNITKEESTDLQVSTEATTIGRAKLTTAIETTTQNTSDFAQFAESSQTRADILPSHEKSSSESIESTYSHAETGFLRDLHQSTDYKESGSELRTGTTHDTQSKQDMSKSIVELGYVDVHADQTSQTSSSVESLRKDRFQVGTEVATSSDSSSTTKIINSTISGSEVRNNTITNSNDTETVLTGRTRDESTRTEISSGLQQGASDTVVSMVNASSMSQGKTITDTKALEASTVGISRRESSTSDEATTQKVVCASTQVRTDDVQNASGELRSETVADSSKAISTSSQLSAASQTVTTSESTNDVTGTGSVLAFESNTTQSVTGVGSAQDTSATTSKDEVSVTERISSSNATYVEGGSSTRNITEQATGKDMVARTTSDTVSETITQLENANVQADANTTASVSQEITDSSVTHDALVAQVTTGKSVMESTEAHEAMTSASKVEESGSSTGMTLGATTQDITAATIVESSHEFTSQESAGQGNATSARVETSAASEKQTETTETSATASVETQTRMDSVSKVEKTGLTVTTAQDTTAVTTVESSNEFISQASAQDNVTSTTSERQLETTETSAAVSNTTIDNVSKVDENQSSTVALETAVQDITTTTAAESSSRSISQVSAQDNVASTTIEASGVSETQADNSAAQIVATSGVTSSTEVSQNVDSETKLATTSEQASKLESVQSERTLDQETELREQTQASTQSTRSDEATETADASVQRSSSTSVGNQQSATEVITTGSHFETTNESISSNVEENRIKTTASDVTAIHEEHHTAVAAEDQETAVHRIDESVKVTRDVVSSTTQAQASINSSSEVSVGDIASRVIQNSTVTQDVHNAAESSIMNVETATTEASANTTMATETVPTEASTNIIKQEGQLDQVSELTKSDVSTEASDVTAHTPTPTAQTAESDMVRSSDLTSSENVVEGSNSVHIDAQTTEHDIGASAAAATEAGTGGTQESVEVAAGIRESSVSEDSSQVVMHSETAEASTSVTGSTAVESTSGALGALESRLDIDTSEKTTISHDGGGVTGLSVTSGTAEKTMAITGTSTTSSVSNVVFQRTESSFTQVSSSTMEEQTSHSFHDRITSTDAQVIESSAESKTTEGVSSLVHESIEYGQSHDSTVQIIAPISEDIGGTVGESTHEDHLLSVHMDSGLGASTDREESHIIFPTPSRRDSMITTSEGSIETTGTLRPSDVSLIRAAMRTASDARNVETVLSDPEDTGLDSTQSSMHSSLILPTQEYGEQSNLNIVQNFADIGYSRRDFTPTFDEVPNIDIESESDQSVEFHDDESALTIDVQTVADAGYTEGTTSRPFSFYSADDQTVNLFTPTEEEDSGSTIFHSGSEPESTPASRTMTSTVEDFQSMSEGDTYISSPYSVNSGYITERPSTSPETSPPISTPATTALSNEQGSIETRTERYSNETTTTQEVSYARQDSSGSSAWGRFDYSALFGRQSNNNKRKSVGPEAFPMAKRT